MLAVSEQLKEILDELRSRRDQEITMAHEVGSQYIADHNDQEAWRLLELQVNALARAWDRMIVEIQKWIVRAEKIEGSVDNFYGK